MEVGQTGLITDGVRSIADETIDALVMLVSIIEKLAPVYSLTQRCKFPLLPVEADTRLKSPMMRFSVLASL